MKKTLILFSGLFLSLLLLSISAKEVNAQNSSGFIAKGNESAAELVKEGDSFSLQGRYEHAITYYDKALEIDPLSVNATNNKGVALYALGKFNDSISYFDKALEIDPTNVKAMYNKGNALYTIGKSDEAIAYYDKALDIDPNNVHALMDKANLLANLHKYVEAIQYYDKILQIDPNNTLAQSNRNFTLSIFNTIQESNLLHYIGIGIVIAGVVCGVTIFYYKKRKRSTLKDSEKGNVM